METIFVICIFFIIVVGSTSFLVSRKIKQVSKAAFGTEDFMQGVKKNEEEYANNPKSVAGMTRMSLPLIIKDFPEFSFEEFKQMTENQLKAILLAISKQDMNILKQADAALKRQVELVIEEDRQRKVCHHYERIKIHQTEITRYQNKEGMCSIMLQSAVGYICYVTDSEESVILGSREIQKQTRYMMELAYVQDADLVRQTKGDNALGITCPSCGAPVKALGIKQCEYCGSAIIEVNRNVWNIHRYEEV